MKLLIDIPEERYKEIVDEQWLPNRLGIEKAIANGTPLPKGHGDLIDRDEFHYTLESMPMRDNDKWFNWLQRACNRLAEAPTIIETDKESEDKE